MSTENMASTERKELSPLETFFVKAGVVTAAIVITLYFAIDFLEGFVERKAEQLAVLKGGKAFWVTMEQKLYTLADEPDLPPERKQKILDALRRLSSKYKPYLEALNGEGAGETTKSR
jgi:hypothetical protein